MMTTLFDSEERYFWKNWKVWFGNKKLWHTLQKFLTITKKIQQCWKFLSVLGSTMTGEALAKIGGFLPRLEKVYLDDIFTDTNYLSRYLITTSDLYVIWTKKINISIAILMLCIFCILIESSKLLFSPNGAHPIATIYWKHGKQLLDQLCVAG